MCSSDLKNWDKLVTVTVKNGGDRGAHILNFTADGAGDMERRNGRLADEAEPEPESASEARRSERQQPPRPEPDVGIDKHLTLFCLSQRCCVETKCCNCSKNH